MRKPIGSWASLTGPVVAAAFFTSGCNEQGGFATGGDVENGSSAPTSILKGADSDVPPVIAQILETCGYEIECKHFADGEFNISGNRKVDAFFAAANDLEIQADVLEAGVKADLGNIAGILGVTVAADADIQALSTAISGYINADFGGMLTGGISLDFKPPQCTVTAQATLEASAKCDVMASGGSATVECKGECVADAEVMASCSGDATLECTGTAPSFACSGMCTGSCNLTTAAECSGECKGTCTVEAEGDCDGTATANEGGADAGFTCETRAGAKCGGTCTGTCELTAAATCEGECKGECKYEAPSGGCTGGAKASCTAEANATVTCEGECKGEIDPPEVNADCQATAKAQADVNAECTPPSVGLSYELSAEAMADLDADAQLEFDAKLRAFATAYGELVAKGAKVELIISSGAGLVAAGGEAVGTLVASLAVDTEADIQARYDGFCAAGELDVALMAVGSAGTSLQASADGIVAITTAIGS